MALTLNNVTDSKAPIPAVHWSRIYLCEDVYFLEFIRTAGERARTVALQATTHKQAIAERIEFFGGKLPEELQ